MNKVFLCALSGLFFYQGVIALNFGLVVLGFLCLLIAVNRPKKKFGLTF